MEKDIASELGLLTINNKDKGKENDNDNLVQIMEAVEAATATIKLQVDENNQLRNELYRKTQELQKYKSNESMIQAPHSVAPWNEQEPYENHQDNTSLVAPHNNLSNPNNWDPDMQTHQKNLQRSKLNLLHSSQAPPDTTTTTGSPSKSFSRTRYQMEGEYDQRVNLSGHGSMPMTQLKIQPHDEEMKLLRKHLAEYSIKETQVRNEKYVLETRIAHMRQAFDQQQQDLVDAASKAISYRQDIIEENIRLTYALQDAQQERLTFISALLPLLTEYSLQPSVPDAQSIVSCIKVLFKHLQEKLIITETKLNDSQYQLAPWHSDINPSNFSTYSPAHSIGAAMNEKGLELVHRPPYSPGHLPTSSSDVRTIRDNDISGRHQSLAKNMETDDLGRYSPFASRNDVSQAHMQGDAHGTLNGQEIPYKQVTFSVPHSRNVTDNRVAEVHQNDRETSINWDSGSSNYTTAHEDPNSTRSPYLPPVLEEQSSSFSEAADEDPLPAIEGLQISGEAFPGQELQASGFSINGTTNCNFEWVRHHEDGSVNYIEGAKQPSYVVTADDVNAYLAIEVQPLDNRNRKGELVRVFSNEHRKITCDPEMHSQIEKTLSSGQASYKLSLSTGYLDIWEPVTLGIKMEGYIIKRSGHSDVIVNEKFLLTTTVSIPYGGQGTEFSIIGSGGDENILRTDVNSTDCSRDMIVLTLRLFILRASNNRKRKKKGLFFNK